MHQRVDLQLGIVKDVLGGLGHAPVDGLPHARVQADLAEAGETPGSSDMVLSGHPPPTPTACSTF